MSEDKPNYKNNDEKMLNVSALIPESLKNFLEKDSHINKRSFSKHLYFILDSYKQEVENRDGKLPENIR